MNDEEKNDEADAKNLRQEENARGEECGDWEEGDDEYVASESEEEQETEEMRTLRNEIASMEEEVEELDDASEEAIVRVLDLMKDISDISPPSG